MFCAAPAPAPTNSFSFQMYSTVQSVLLMHHTLPHSFLFLTVNTVVLVADFGGREVQPLQLQLKVVRGEESQVRTAILYMQ